MEASSFSRNLDSLSFVSGVSFSLEQRASLPLSLSILKSQQNLSQVLLWGRILGEKADYLIAQGVNPKDLSKDESSNRGRTSIVLANFFETLAHIEKKNYRLTSLPPNNPLTPQCRRRHMGPPPPHRWRSRKEVRPVERKPSLQRRHLRPLHRRCRL
jgi:hypothetical protein